MYRIALFSSSKFVNSKYISKRTFNDQFCHGRPKILSHSPHEISSHKKLYKSLTHGITHRLP